MTNTAAAQTIKTPAGPLTPGSRVHVFIADGMTPFAREYVGVVLPLSPYDRWNFKMQIGTCVWTFKPETVIDFFEVEA